MRTGGAVLEGKVVKHSITLTKTITKVGNSQGIMFDAAIMEMARLKVGDQVNVELHERRNDHDHAAAAAHSIEDRGGDRAAVDSQEL